MKLQNLLLSLFVLYLVYIKLDGNGYLSVNIESYQTIDEVKQAIVEAGKKKAKRREWQLKYDNKSQFDLIYIPTKVTQSDVDAFNNGMLDTSDGAPPELNDGTPIQLRDDACISDYSIEKDGIIQITPAASVLQ